jgi:uncharacterized protein YjiS (DUF1127 family)
MAPPIGISANQKQTTRVPEDDLQALTSRREQKRAAGARCVVAPFTDKKDRTMIVLEMLTQLALWQDRIRSRRMLLQLDDHLLQDIGETKDMRASETGKPWWLA